MGKIASYSEVGMSYGMVKQALMADGMSAMMADALIKEAGIASGIGRGLGWIGGQLGKLAPAAVRSTPGVTTVLNKPGLLSRMGNWLGGQAGNAGKAFSNAGTGLSTAATQGNVGNFMLGGVKNFGRGIIGQGQGLGAGMGKAVGAGTLGYGAYSMVRPNPQPQYAQR